MNILVTGAAGFIGYHLSKKLLELGHEVVGLDNINDYYDIDLKYARLNELGIRRKEAEQFLQLTKSSLNENMSFIRMNLEDRNELPNLFSKCKFDIVCNLAAQAGVRYSLENPETYIDSNVVGYLNLLECCRNHKIIRLLYASSSSVYGENKELPFHEEQKVDKPISLYAATKKTNELMAHTYSHLFGIETVGLRFFTVYGPWGRPDMALFLFTDAILKDEPIKIFNEGKMCRDFTYIDDIIDGVLRLIQIKLNCLSEIYNIGHGKPVALKDFIKEIELQSERKAKYNELPLQPGDAINTWADTRKLVLDTGYDSKTALNVGVKCFVKWFIQYKNRMEKLA